MAKIQNINAELAAHKIASAISNKFLDQLRESKNLSPDSPGVCTVAKKAAQVYAIAYDEAYEYFFNENEISPNYPDRDLT